MVKKHIAEPIKNKKDIKAVEKYLKEHNKRNTEQYYNNTLLIALDNVNTDWTISDLSRWIDAKIYAPEYGVDIFYNFDMKLRTIKSKIGNKIYTDSYFKEMELIKRACNIPQDSVMFYLSYFKGKQIFLCEGYIYVANNKMEYAEHEPIISTMELIELYRVKLYKDYPKTLKDIEYEVKIIKDPHYTFTPEEFLFWTDSPCDINHEIDAPYYEVIKFLNGYNRETFRTERYLFYSKRDDDYNFVNYIYAYDLKTEEEIKLYTIDDWCDFGEYARVYTPPMTLKDVAADNTDTKLSLYQQRECKKAFLEIAHKINPIFKLKIIG